MKITQTFARQMGAALADEIHRHQRPEVREGILRARDALLDLLEDSGQPHHVVRSVSAGFSARLDTLEPLTIGPRSAPGSAPAGV